MIIKLSILLLLFQIKHFIADFPLQNKYMLGKFKDEGWILPLLSHGLIHAVITFLICVCFSTVLTASILSIFDLIVHSAMDRVKASPKMLGRYGAISKRDVQRGNLSEQDWKDNTYFWWALGVDQMVHHVTHYVVIVVLLS